MDFTAYYPREFPFSRSHIMTNGFCGLMADQRNQNCTTWFGFSNPNIYFKEQPTGTYTASNSLWLKDSRFLVANLGAEKKKCLEFGLELNFNQ